MTHDQIGWILDVIFWLILFGAFFRAVRYLREIRDELRCQTACRLSEEYRTYCTSKLKAKEEPLEFGDWATGQP
ncbi:MAG TPA: hypothetical protein VG206_13730 [Terriglobia bacterium]|nr:hypothetical protein [Terriglobia bacterium]